MGQNGTFIIVLGDLSLPWLKRLVDNRLQLRRGINPKSICVRFFVEKATLGQVSPNTSGLPESIIHQSSTPVFIATLLLPEGQAGEVWEAYKKTVLFRVSGNTGLKSEYTLMLRVTRPQILIFCSSCISIYLS